MTPPQTYNDERIDQKSRQVFWKALEVADKLLDDIKAGTPVSPEKLHAVAAIMDGSYCGVDPQEEADASY